MDKGGMLAAMTALQTEGRRGGGLRGNRWWWVALAAGLVLRLWFTWHPMPFDDDTTVYAELGRNLFHHGVYGFGDDSGVDPSLIRLPGYPIFLSVIFAMVRSENFHAVIAAQIGFDLLGCWLIGSFVREQVSERAGTVAIFLAALCPFTAAYSTTALTECLSVFAVSLGLRSAGQLLSAQAEGVRDRGALLYASLAMAIAVLLRPDGALLGAAVIAAIVWYAWRQGRLLLGVKTALLCGVLAVLPLAPWTVRNWRTFHVIQPLAPRRVNDPGERVYYGFYRWMSTWSVDFVSTGNVFWKVYTEPIEIGVLPARAIGSAAERAETKEILDEHNVNNTMSPELDAKFAALASERVRAHPFLCRVWVPMLKVTDMWLRPRTETLGLDADWWRFDEHRMESVEAVGLGMVNLAIVGATVVGVVRRRMPWVALAVVYVALRCVLLSTMENSEPRYTLEAFPILLASAACAFSGRRVRSAADSSCDL